MSFDNDMLCKLFIFHHLCGIRLHNWSLEWLWHCTCHCGHVGQMIRLEMHILYIHYRLFLICTGTIFVYMCWVETKTWAKEMLANLKL